MTFAVPRHLALSALALAVTSLTHFAYAQTEPALSSVLVTASRTPQAAIDVLADHVIIDAETIARSGVTNVADLLQQQRAIEITRNGGPGANTSVYIRGADGKQSVVLIDGVRIGSSTSGTANWSTLPLENVERIEIVYGPLATMYGADAIGGVVQIFTRKGAGPARFAGSLQAGSRGARLGEVALYGSANAVSYAFSLAQSEDDGFSSTRAGLSSHNPDRDGYRRDSAGANVSLRIGQRSEVGVLYLHSHLKNQYDAGASGFDARSVQNQDNAALYATHRFTPDWNVRLQVAESTDEATTIASATSISRIQTRQHFYSAQSELAIGADLLQLIVERRFEDVVSSTSGALTRTRATNSLAGAYSLKRGAHLASLSVRMDDSTQYDTKTTGGIGYGYRLSPEWRVHASAGTSFRAPTFNELYFGGYGVPTNRPERGRNGETGLYFRNAATSASLVAYHNRLTDLLVNQSPCPAGTRTEYPTGCAYNVNRATLRGVSAAASHKLGAVDFSTTLDWQDPRDDTTGRMLQRRAKRHGTVRADYSAGPWTAGAALVFAGRRFDDAANRNELGGYGLLNLHASYRFAPGWSALVRWNNATDKQYELARYYQTAGSSVFAGIRYGVN